MSAVGENELNQYIYTKMAVGSLNANDTLALTTRHTQFDSIVKNAAFACTSDADI